MADGGIPLIGALATLGSGIIGGIATAQAANAQAKAIRYAADQQSQSEANQLALLQPAINAGNTARDYQLGALGLPGGVDYNTALAAFRSSPGYENALKTGLNSVQTSAAAGGDLFSGKTLKSLSNYGQNMADQQFGNWLSDLGGISGNGLNATGRGADVIGTGGNNLADLAVQGGANQASSYVNGANLATGVGQSLADMYAYYNPPGWKPYMASGAPMNLTGAAYG